MFSKFNLPFLLVLMLGQFLCDSVEHEMSPKIEVSCDTNGFYVRLIFSRPFRGSVYSAGHFMDSLCSFPSCPDDDKRMDVFIPKTACGTRVKETDTSHVLLNTIIIQEHSILQTSWDVVQPLTCTIPHIGKLPLIQKNGGFGKQDLKDGVEAWMELRLGTEILGKEASEAQLGDDLLLAIYVKDGGKNKDINVRNCIAHDAETIEQSTSVAKVSDGYGCKQSDFISDFTVTKSTKSDLMAHSTFRAFKFPTRGQLYLTCALQLCEESCPRTCDASESIGAVVRKKLMKRSITETEALRARQYEERNRLMKATIKALASKLIKYNRKSKALNSADAIEKRIWKGAYTTTETVDTESIAETDVFTEVSEFTDLEEFTTLLNSIPTEIQSTLASFKKNSEDFLTDLEVTTDSATDLFTKSPTVNALTTLSVLSSEKSVREYNFNVTKNIIVLSPSDESRNDAINLMNEREDCVPRLRFSLVTGLLTFILFCSVLTCTALVLHMRKEKKKHLIENFLLYNFN